MDYGKLLSRSWQIVWHNKFLFILGFLAALGSGGGGGGSAPNANFSGSDASDFDLPPGAVENMETFWATFGGVVLGLLCLFLIIGVVLWLVRLISQAGMIDAVARLDAGESMNFGAAFRAGRARLGRMVGLNLVLNGPFLLVGLIAAAVFTATLAGAIFSEVAGSGAGEGILAGLGIFAICGVALACLLIPLYLVVLVVEPFAQRGVVLQEMGVMDSIRHGWEVVRANFGDVVLIIIIFVVLGFLVGIVSVAILLPVGLVMVVPAIIGIVNGAGSVGVLEIGYLILVGFLIAVVGAAINSILTAFRSTAVTLAYQEFVTKDKEIV